MIKGIGKSKGFGLKSVTISFEPPTFNKIDVFGFPIPIPKVSLPKVDIKFEMDLKNEMSHNINNSIIIKEFLIRFKNTSGDFNIILEQLKSIIYDLTIKWDRQRRYVTNIRYLPITYGKDSFSEDYAEIKVEFDFNSIEIGDFFREVSDKVYDKFSSFILLTSYSH